MNAKAEPGARILWLDNDREQVDVFAQSLRACGYEVEIVGRLLEAEAQVRKGGWALLILDVQVPVWSDEEEREYPPQLTDFGRNSGLRFYDRMRPYLEPGGTPVLVLTTRDDGAIVDAFHGAGLPDGCFDTKFNLRDPDQFLAKVTSLVEAR